MPRKRDYKAEYARRQARAREAGFSGYYARRVRGGAPATPDTPAPTGDELRRARGHAGTSALIREFEPSSSVRVGRNLRTIESDDSGAWVEIPIVVTTPDGDEREYWLHNISPDELDYIIDELEDLDADFEEDYDLRALGG